MKIAVIHNYYREAGGEDVAVRAEIGLLRSRGHSVETFEVSSQGIGSGFYDKLKVARDLSHSKPSKKRLSEFLALHRPDIAHVHNWFPLLTPSVYDACLENRIPIVQTLHNYRTICSNGLLLRDGKPCENCVQGSPYQGVLHACYRNSRFASLPIAKMIDRHRREGTWNSSVNRFIALSEFSKSVFVRAGFDAGKISIKSNFVDDPYLAEDTIVDRSNQTGKAALFVGRLSPEKGIRTLIEAWRKIEMPLHVIGDGPLKDELQTSARANRQIEFLGRQSATEVSEAMKKASFLVMPSECYETFGLVVVEAFAHAIPVVVSDAGSPRELVEDGKTGLVFKSGDPESLGATVRKFSSDPGLASRLGARARETYLEKYTPERNYQALIQIYLSAMGTTH